MKYTFLYLLFVLFFISCHKTTKCIDTNEFTFLTSVEKEIVPYHGNELLKFKSSEGDTLSFLGKDELQTFYKTQKIDFAYDCIRNWYLEKLIYKFICVEDSNLYFEVSNRALTDHSFSSLDIYIKRAPGIRSEDYNLTHINHFKDSLQINGKNYKA